MRTTLTLNETADGLVPFVVADTIETPFLLVWWPQLTPDAGPVVIVVDRLLPWERPSAAA
jgi:hypothetical protein